MGPTAISTLSVLTLPGVHDRQQQARHWLVDAGLDPDAVFIDGVDLRQPCSPFVAPAAGRLLRQQRYGRPELNQPEYGCLLGHHRIWRRLLQNRLPWACVIEDDAIPLRHDWLPATKALGCSLQRSRLGGTAWVVHLGMTAHNLRTLALQPLHWLRPAADVPPVGIVDRRLGNAWTTLAYMISREAAAALLEAEIALPWLADDWSERLRSGSLSTLLAASPPLFGVCDGFASQIAERCGQVNEPPLRRPLRKALTLVYRLGLGGVHC